MPASDDVTNPPTQMSGNTAQTKSVAGRCGRREVDVV
jgi:hypothetical protein